jgi:hypothetical protein
MERKVGVSSPTSIFADYGTPKNEVNRPSPVSGCLGGRRRRRVGGRVGEGGSAGIENEKMRNARSLYPSPQPATSSQPPIMASAICLVLVSFDTLATPQNTFPRFLTVPACQYFTIGICASSTSRPRAFQTQLWVVTPPMLHCTKCTFPKNGLSASLPAWTRVPV